MFLALATKVATVSGPDTARFGAIVNKRRRELGLSLDDVAAAGGPSQVTVSNIEQGSTNRPHFATFGKLDDVLGWTPGSAARTFDGDSPTPLETSGDTVPRTRRVTQLSPDVAVVSIRTIGDLLVSAQKIERMVTSDSSSPELKQAASELDIIVDRIMRTWIISQMEDRRSNSPSDASDPMIDMFISDYLARAGVPTTDSDAQDLAYLHWLTGKSDESNTDEVSAFERRWQSSRGLQA